MKRHWALVLAIVSIVLGAVNPVLASEGGIRDGGNGGDICEDHFKLVRDDISAWIMKGGSGGLTLPKDIPLAQYNSAMTFQIANAQVSCTSDAVLVDGLEKVCKNFNTPDGKSKIVCNSKRFLETKASDQYVLVHHEYAGLSGVEVNDEDGSHYFVSNQITDYLNQETVTRLAIKPYGRSRFEFPGYLDLYVGTYEGKESGFLFDSKCSLAFTKSEAQGDQKYRVEIKTDEVSGVFNPEYGGWDGLAQSIMSGGSDMQLTRTVGDSKIYLEAHLDRDRNIIGYEVSVYQHNGGRPQVYNCGNLKRLDPSIDSASCKVNPSEATLDFIRRDVKPPTRRNIKLHYASPSYGLIDSACLPSPNGYVGNYILMNGTVNCPRFLSVRQGEGKETNMLIVGDLYKFKKAPSSAVTYTLENGTQVDLSYITVEGAGHIYESWSDSYHDAAWRGLWLGNGTLRYEESGLFEDEHIYTECTFRRF